MIAVPHYFHVPLTIRALECGRLVYEAGKLEFLRNEIEMSEFCKNSTSSFSVPPLWKVEIPVNSDGSHQHRDVLANFCDAIQNNVPLIAPATEGIRGLELGNAMLLSGLKHKSVKLPIDSDEFAAMLEDLVKTSRYVKKETIQTGDEDFSKSFAR